MTFKKMNKLNFVSLALLMALALPLRVLSAPEPESFAQAPATKAVSGIVADENGSPLVGVTVVNLATGTGVVTNSGGQFTVQATPENVLRFSYLGYAAQEITVGSQTSVNVVLREEASSIDDVIVIGYGTTTRRRATGAVDQITSSVLQDKPVANVKQALQGASPSIVIQTRSYNPNSDDVSINIRGISSMNDNAPLLVIDGLISDMGAFNKLNPTDIENISVLKDAGTAAIYGSRAANGVILITTKKGRKNQAPVVSINTSVGWQQPQQLFHPVKGYQNATLYNQYKIGGGEDPVYTAADIRNFYEQGDARWAIYEITQAALQQNYNVSVSGGGENSTYMVSAGYYDQASNYVGNFGTQRYNFRSNVTAEYGRLKFTGLMSYVRNNSMATTGSSLEINSTRIPPYYYTKLKDEQTGHYLVNDLLSDFNALGLLESGGFDKYRNDYININTGLDFRIIDGLTLRGVFGADIFNDHRYTRRFEVDFYSYDDPTSLVHTANTDRDTEDYNSHSYLTNSQIMLDFARQFGRHRVSALFGASNESYTSRSSTVKILYSDVDLGIKGDGSEVSNSSSVTPENTTRTSIVSLFGRVGYDWDDKYYFDASFRYDGSSKFSKDDRWGFFPSASAAWRISQEDFMENYRNVAGDLKLRLSYGVLGNQAVGSYQYFTTYDIYSDTYAYNNSMAGGAGFTLGADNLTWEKVQTFNIGTDLSFFNNTLNMQADYYFRKTVDILVAPTIPLIYGTTLSNHNAGEMKSQGWELSISYLLRHGDWRHTFNFNMGDAWNKVTKYTGFENFNQSDEIIRIQREGLPFNSYYGYKVAGIFQSYDEIANSSLPTGANVHPGDLKFVDRNGDGVIDENDRFYLGHAFPRYSFGFNYTVQWKGLEFNVFLQGVLKRTQAIRGELVEPFHGSYSYMIYQHQLDFWTPTNTSAKFPRLNSNNSNNWGTASDIYMFDGKYMRVKDIMVGYNLPKSIVQKIGMSNLRVYVNARNLFTFTPNSWVDPESTEFGSNMNPSGANSARNYPALKYYGMGLDITF